MIISQTPLRLSFCGGGTDLPGYYKKNGGAVVSTAIDKYIFVIVNERFDNLIYINYSVKEIVNSIDEIKHELVRESAKITGLKNGFEVTILADIPSEGSGLGSSSSLTVGLLNAFFNFKGIQQTAETLAMLACEIEINCLKKPIGKQDQYIAAYGGLQYIEFLKNDKVTVQEIEITNINKIELMSNLMLFYTNITRKSSDILTKQSNSIKKSMKFYDTLKKYAVETKNILIAGDFKNFGKLLHENWELKKKLSNNISNPQIDEMYNSARLRGASGGKIAGAGGGGFLLLYCDKKYQDVVRKELKGFREMKFLFEPHGSKIIFNLKRYDWK